MPSTRTYAIAAAVLVIVLLAFLLGRCTAPEGAQGATGPDGTVATTSTTWAADEEHHLILDEPDAFLTALRRQIDGPVTVSRVIFYPDSAFADVQDPTHPSHLDEYSFRDGVLDPEPSPVAAGRLETWEDSLFTLEVVHADVIRSVGRRAVQEFDDLENGELTHLVVSRSYGGDLEIDVYVSDSIRGGSGYLSADAQGNVLDISES